MPQNVL